MSGKPGTRAPSGRPPSMRPPITRTVAVLGGGEFGSALARASARTGQKVLLWSRRGTPILSDNIRVTTAVADLAEADLLFLAVPSEHVEKVASEVGEHLDGRHFLVHVSRGLVGAELTPLTHVLRTVTPCRRIGALAGPLRAQSLANGTPGGAIIGTRFREVADAVRDVLGTAALRVESTEDVTGVEVASAMVGLLALGAGYLVGAKTDPAAIAVYLSRGMHEATRLGVYLGADERTFAGLAGFGDLLAVAAGDDRPEVRLGLALAAGSDLAGAASRTGAHVEGVSIAQRVAEFAEKRGIKAPITTVLADMVGGKLRLSDLAHALVSR